MGRICGNCGTEMEQLNDTQHYCEKCDETFTVSKGKQVVSKKKNLLEQLKDTIIVQGDRIKKLEDSQEADDRFVGF